MTTQTVRGLAPGQRPTDIGEVAKHWIDGEWIGSDAISESINPATVELLGRWADGGEAEARAAVDAARHAFDASLWPRDRNLRNRALSEMADRFDARADELGRLVTKENGKKLTEGMLEATSRPSPIVRGGPPTDGALATGAFYRPTVLEVEDVNTQIVQKEVFGPVATFEVFETEHDAIARANATEMGLAAGVFTNDINISRRVSREVQAGTIWTNAWAAINDGFAEGGYKASGIGRLRGPLSITEFQEAKTVVHAIPSLPS